MKDKIIEILEELSEYPQFNVSCKKYLMDYNYEEAATRIVELKEEYDLAYCNNCIQMTNHIKGVCQKCKAKEEPTAEGYVLDLINYTVALTNYIEFLGYELDELAPIAHTHGWRSGRVKEGERLRSELEQLKSKAGLTDKQ